MIELRRTNKLSFRKRIGIEFPVRVRIVKRTSKAILAIPLRKRRHGCYVPELWIPRSMLSEPLHDDQDVTWVEMPMWLWEENTRPEPPAVADAAGVPS